MNIFGCHHLQVTTNASDPSYYADDECFSGSLLKTAGKGPLFKCID